MTTSIGTVGSGISSDGVGVNDAPTFVGGDGKAVVAVGAAQDYASSSVLQPDGKLLVAGTSYASSGYGDFSVIRLNANGTLDTGFGVAGRAIVPVDTGSDDASGIARTTPEE